MKQNTWPRHLTLPGLLEDVIRRRREEFAYPTFSPFGIELVAYDLRERFPRHYISEAYLRESSTVQDALDLDLAENYRPTVEHTGPLMQVLFPSAQATGDTTAPTRPAQPASPGLVSYREWVFFPQRFRPMIEQRICELGYKSVSAYVTGLIRYDLLLGGTHRLFNGADTDPEMLAALDAETERTFHEPKQRRTRLEDFIEQAAGQKLTDEERIRMMLVLFKKLREDALRRRAERRKDTR